MSSSVVQLGRRVSPLAVRIGVRVVVLAVIAALGLVLFHNIAGGSKSGAAYRVPQSAAMEDQLGIRISSIAVVGDGGLITFTYVVLDAEKATRFQSDTAHPAALKSEARKGGTTRISVMKQGHTLKAGQSYYLVYQNTLGAIRHGEKVTISYGSLSLPHVPVL
ncbi:MAG: hypothetical protein QOJ62_1225 [Actinomycetota bacterium]|nr:hypothetical protein [Actinomycetota bacterium]